MLTVPAFLLMKTLSLSSTSGVEPAPVSSSLDTYSGQLPSQQPQNSVEKRGYAPFSSSPFLYTSQFVGFLFFFFHGRIKKGKVCWQLFFKNWSLLTTGRNTPLVFMNSSWTYWVLLDCGLSWFWRVSHLAQIFDCSTPSFSDCKLRMQTAICSRPKNFLPKLRMKKIQQK